MSFEPISAAYKTASALTRAIPWAAADALGRLASWGAVNISAERRLLVERNLKRADPDLEGEALRRAVHENFRLYTRYWIESFRLPGLTLEELDGEFSYEGYGHIVDGLRHGRGVVLALPHLGGWEWAGIWMSRVVDQPLTVVVESVEPPELLEFFVELREKLGMNIVTLGPAAGPAILRALNQNQIVCLLVDRDIEGNGIAVDFFGERTTMPAGPAMMALRTGAVLLSGAIYFRGNGHHAVIEGPIDTERHGRMRADVTRITADIATRLENLIRAAPQQWHLQQPNWPSDYEALEAIGKPHPLPVSLADPS